MNNNTLHPNKETGLENKEKAYDDQFTPADIEMYIPPVAYWFAGNYSGPFTPMADISFVFDGLKKMFKGWLAVKNKN